MPHALQEALPELLKSKGVVVNVSSVAGHFPCPGNSAYGAAKAAQNMVGCGLQASGTLPLPAMPPAAGHIATFGPLTLIIVIGATPRGSWKEQLP